MAQGKMQGGPLYRAGLVAMILVCGLAVSGARGQTIGVPGISGDQLLFLYDARPDRVTYLSVANPADEAIALDVALYSVDLQSVLARQTIVLDSAANQLVDPTIFAGGGANGAAGLAVMTPVANPENPTPVVPPVPIVGGFTLANVQLKSGFGQNPLARMAVDGAGEPAVPGRFVDGVNASYERFVPGVLMIPVYFDPTQLSPPENDGNRVLLAAFEDDYDGGFSLAPLQTEAQVSFFDGEGRRIVVSSVALEGVELTNLQALGTSSLEGSGKVFFEVDAKGGNVFGLFSQSIETFAAGQRMPAVAQVPVGTQPLEVAIEFDARVNGETFACGQSYSGIGSTNAIIEPADCRMYIQDLSLVDDGGREVALALEQDGIWQTQNVALLDFENATGRCSARGTLATNRIIRGTIPAARYERLRFWMGVPEDLNHADAATAPSPLNVTTLFWSWNAGYKFIRYDNIVEETDGEFRVHIGSTLCEGDGRGEAVCANSNRVLVDIPFEPGADRVLINLASFFVGTDVEQNSGAPGCMSDAGDPECVGVFARAGLPYGDAPGGEQQIFTTESPG